jgi:hypothetical protein
MKLLLPLILGVVFIVLGIKMYSYFDTNIDAIDNEPGKLYGIAVLVIIMGITVIIMSLISYFLNM